MALTSEQNGTAVTIETRPTFTGFINTDFPENNKFREQETIIGEEGKAVTEVGCDDTSEVTAKLALKSGTTPPGLFDVLTETTPTTRKWLVLEVGRPRKAGMTTMYDLKLKRSEGVTLA